mmetsp:Transcript_35656/g.42967  ORF Transcript_35656/g.42967 Transcript_35656/m.42967 type:complete len:87 (+) Transcript_35656:1410-1670(+)
MSTDSSDNILQNVFLSRAKVGSENYVFGLPSQRAYEGTGKRQLMIDERRCTSCQKLRGCVEISRGMANTEARASGTTKFIPDMGIL